MTVFVGAEWITGMMLGIEFRSRVAIFDLLIVRIYVGVVDEQ